MTVLRRAFVEVSPDTQGFDAELTKKLKAADPGGKAGKLIGKQLGGRLNLALAKLDLPAIDIEADPKAALAAIAATENRLRALSRDSATVEVKVRTERALSQLSRFRKQIGDVGDDGAQGLVAKLSQGLTAGSALLGNHVGLTIGGAAGIAAAPVIISALQAGVSAGLGGGVLAVGLAALAKDPKIAARGAEVGKHFTDALQAEAGKSLQGPALRSLNEVDALGQRTAQRLGKAFEALAPALGPLTDQLTASVDILGTDLTAAAAQSGPALDGLGDSVLLLSQGLGDAVTILSKGGPEAASNLRLIAGVTADAAKQSAAFLTTLSKLGNSPWVTGPLLPLLRAHYDDASKAAQENADQTINVKTALNSVEIAAAAAAAGQKAVADASTLQGQAQNALTASLNQMGGAQSLATQQATALRTATQNLYGAQISGIEANEKYQSSWDALSESVKKNKGSLDVHTTSGRANRDALEGLLSATNENYFADIAAGTAIDAARVKHDNRIKSIKEEARRLGLNKTATQELIDTYGKIPGKKTTDLVLDGVNKVVDKLNDLYRLQRALAEGKTPWSIEPWHGTNRDFKATGGPITGPGTKTSDSVPIMASRGEFMQQAAAVDYYGTGFMHAINNRQFSREDLPGFAGGGQIAGVDTSHAWPFVTDVSHTKIPSKASVLAKVAPAVPLGGPTLDFMTRAVRAAFPGMRLISGYRPGAHTLTGNLSYHALKRASDWPASRPLAEWVNAKYKSRTKELITPWNDLNIHNGQRHTYTGAVWNQHNFAGGNAHDHWAMDNGGYLMPGWNPPIYNGTGRAEPVTPGADMDRVVGLLSSILEATKGVAPGVGRHVNRAVGSVDAGIGALAGLNARGAW